MRVEKPHGAVQPRPADDLLDQARPLGRVHGGLCQPLFGSAGRCQSGFERFRRVLRAGIAAPQHPREHRFFLRAPAVFIAAVEIILSERRKERCKVLAAIKAHDRVAVLGERRRQFTAPRLNLYQPGDQRAADRFGFRIFCSQRCNGRVRIREKPDLLRQTALRLREKGIERIAADQSKRLGAEIILCLQSETREGARVVLDRVFQRKPLCKALVRELRFSNFAAQNHHNRMIDAQIIVPVKAVAA